MRYKLINLLTFYRSKNILKTLKAKNKIILKIFIYTIILVGYILGFAVIFNLKSVLGIGNYEGAKSYNISLNGDSGGLNIEMYTYHDTELYHDYGYKITAFANGDIEIVGMAYADFRVRTGSTLRHTLIENFTIPIPSYSYEGYASIRQNANYTIKGFVDVIFTINNINQTHRIAIDFGIVIELDGNEINYEWGNLSTWLNVIYLAFTAIPSTLLYRSIKIYRFRLWYNEEIEERDQKFLRVLSKQNEE